MSHYTPNRQGGAERLVAHLEQSGFLIMRKPIEIPTRRWPEGGRNE